MLRAAAEQGITLMHGCKEGQCASCKSFVLDGDDIELDKYSTFALPDFELDEGFTLLCRAHVYEDVTIELLNYDEEMIRSGHPIQEAVAEVVSNEHVTHDMRHLVLKLIEPTEHRVLARPVRRHHDPGHRRDPVVLDGQHVEQGERPARVRDQVYPDGQFSHFLDTEVSGRRPARPGRSVRRLHPARRPRLRHRLRRGRRRDGADPVPAAVAGRERTAPRKATYYYGARTQKDLCFEKELYALAESAAELHVRAGALRGRPRRALGRRGRPDHRRREEVTRPTSRRPTPTSAARRRWSRRPWRCSAGSERPRRTSTTTSSPPPVPHE